jgi:hypothetical protein
VSLFVQARQPDRGHGFELGRHRGDPTEELDIVAPFGKAPRRHDRNFRGAAGDVRVIVDDDYLHKHEAPRNGRFMLIITPLDLGRAAEWTVELVSPFDSSSGEGLSQMI